MSQSHKVIGLVSGGKDSCFNLLHCVANGHEIVALATLTPEPGTDELDSHLYQSVGTSLPPLIAKSMGIPHYSRVIKGKAVSQGPEYGDRTRLGEGSGTKGDETEDLTELLLEVMKNHPTATALSTGAILSTYQRLRIEHVASRLGLVSLAYLWQADQLSLLEQMRDSGMEVILVKVAGVGLGREMVGKSLWDVLPTLRKLERIYGSHPAGEGGEYETLTLSFPLARQRIRIIKSEVVVTDPEPNEVAYLRIHEAELVMKEDQPHGVGEGGTPIPNQEALRRILGLPRIPTSIAETDSSVSTDETTVQSELELDGKEATNGEAWLDARGAEALEEIRESKNDNPRTSMSTGALESDLDSNSVSTSTVESGSNLEVFEPDCPAEISALAIDRGEIRDDGKGKITVGYRKRGRWFAVSVCAMSGVGSEHGKMGIGEQIKRCFNEVSAHLSSQTPSLSLPLHSTHITLLLPSMSLFPIANAAYSSFFGISPPSRATVAVELDEGVDVVIEVVGYDSGDCDCDYDYEQGGGEGEGMGDGREGGGGRVGRARRAGRVGGRSSLHVQSMSYWAPANIGPYSQAITVSERVHIAGQIPLIPPTLALPVPLGSTSMVASTLASPYPLQSTLALQHVRKVVHVLQSPSQTGGGWEGWVEGCVAWWAGVDAQGGGRGEAGVVGEAWRIWVEQMNFDVDVPLIIVQARELPKGALVEYQVNLHTGRRIDIKSLGDVVEGDAKVEEDDEEDDDDEDEDEMPNAVYTTSGTVGSGMWSEMYEAVQLGKRSRRVRVAKRGVVFISEITSVSADQLGLIVQDAIAIRVYHTVNSQTATRFISRVIGRGESPCVTFIPVVSIHDRNGTRAGLAIDLFA